MNLVDTGAGHDASARLFNLLNHGVADLDVVNDAFLGDVNGGDARHMRFDFEHLRAVQQAEALQAVLLAALVEVVQAGQFGFVHRNHELAADFMADAVLFAEGNHFLNAGNGQPGFERTRLVVQSGVKNAAVVAGLVAGDAVFLFKDNDLRGRKAAGQFHGSGQANYSAANDDDPLFSHFTKISPERLRVNLNRAKVMAP